MKATGQKKTGFTLVEMLVVVIIIGIIAAIAVPEIIQAINRTKASECGAAIRTIESAKSRFKFDHPYSVTPLTTVTLAQLQTYFPGGEIPKDPWGVGFNNILNLDAVTTHDYNNSSGNYGDVGGTNLLLNGLNDGGQPVR